MPNQGLGMKPVVGGLSALALLMGCAAQKPAPQFTKAQQTYMEASNGKAQEYAPDELLEAKSLLDEAANSKNGSHEQIHFAYLADRQARLASSSGSIEYYQKQAVDAESRYVAGLEEKSSSTQEELEQTREEKERESTMSAKALSQSEKARKDAEARAAAAMASLGELAQVKEEAHETVITLSGSVLFKTGQAELLPIAETSLAKVAEAIKTMDDEKQIVVEGYTDSRGAPEMNKELSQKRAESVMNYLAGQGVEKSRMKAVGKGESDPVADNESPEGRANNRRVELHITNGSQVEDKSADTVSDKGGSAS